MSNSTMPRLYPEEKFNGWTAESLEAYRRERDLAAGSTITHPDAPPSALVPGFVPTEYQRKAPPIRIETALSYDPHRRK